MKCAKRLLCLLLIALLLTGCTPGSPDVSNSTAPEASGAVLSSQAPQGAALTEQALAQISTLGESPDDNYRTWYEIFVYSFCDSNGDGIGDLAGVTSKLDYLEELGINGIWLMPIHPSTSYHKYNVSDYYAIDPAYGTMENFETLLRECEARGIKVIMDLVLNHSGSEHEWFKQACDYLRSLPSGAEPDPAACPYVDYYTFVRADSAPAAYSAVSGTADWYYESKFNFDMPDLNLANEALRAELEAVMKFWLDKGVGGFRLDAAKEFYSNDSAKNIEVLNWIQQTAVGLKPDCYLVAEVWEGFTTIAKYYTSGITSIFNFAFAGVDGKIISVLRGAGQPSVVSTYATALEKAETAYREGNPDCIDAPFLSNHDLGRIAGFVGRDPAKTKLAGAMNLFMSGSAFIYYGEELGMICGDINDPSFRAPMYWSADDSGLCAPAPGCTLPEEYVFGSLADQREDDGSIYNYYRQAVAIRNALPVISHGSTTPESALNAGCISAQRKSWNGQECIILMNISAEGTQMDLSAYAGWTLAASLSADGNPVALAEGRLDLPAYGTAILLPTP